jgi:hypothetical protein
MRDGSLLKIERKLETFSTKDILLSKFILKPKMDRTEIIQGKDFLKNIGSFINDFKKQNNELLNDENKAKELNIEEGAELAKNDAEKEIKNKKKDKKVNKQKAEKNQSNNINAEKNEEKKFIELNLKLGVLDLIKKENNDNKKKVLIEEIINDENNKQKINIQESPSSVNDIVSNDSEKDENTNIIKKLNKSKGKNYLDFLKRNDSILKSVTNKNNDLTAQGNNGFQEYPFLDLKDDVFNKEVLNFLMENSKNKEKEKEGGSKKKKRRILSSQKNDIIDNNSYYEINMNI